MTVLTEDNQLNREILIKAAYDAFPDNKILAQLTIAQGILEAGLETGRSPSQLALQHNNLFGMKAKVDGNGNPITPAVLLPTKEEIHGQLETVHAYFRVFDSVEACLEARKELFQLQRYQNLWMAKTFYDAAHLVKQDGYATASNYPDELITVYNQYIKEN